MLHIVQVINKNKLGWFRHERVKAKGSDDVEDEGKYTTRTTNTKVTKQHR